MSDYITPEQLQAVLAAIVHGNMPAPQPTTPPQGQAVGTPASGSTANPSAEAPGRPGLLAVEASHVHADPPTTIARITGRTPQTRVMSPSTTTATTMGFRAAQQLCTTHLQALDGPTALCASCHGAVHAYCVVTHMHEFLCRPCYQEHEAVREAQRQRELAHRVAHGLGSFLPRSSELLGTAVGAVGGATLAAGQFLAAGAAAGARAAWTASRPHVPSSDLRIHLPPRPVSLPPPPLEDQVADGRPVGAPLTPQGAETQPSDGGVGEAMRQTRAEMDAMRA